MFPLIYIHEHRLTSSALCYVNQKYHLCIQRKALEIKLIKKIFNGFVMLTNHQLLLLADFHVSTIF